IGAREGPPVGPGAGTARPRRDDWLERDDESLRQPGPIARIIVVRHARAFVNASPDAVSAQVAEDAEALPLDLGLHLATHYRQPLARARGAHAAVEGRLGAGDQASTNIRYRRHAYRHRGVREVSVQLN